MRRYQLSGTELEFHFAPCTCVLDSTDTIKWFLWYEMFLETWSALLWQNDFSLFRWETVMLWKWVSTLLWSRQSKHERFCTQRIPSTWQLQWGSYIQRWQNLTLTCVRCCKEQIEQRSISQIVCNLKAWSWPGIALGNMSSSINFKSTVHDSKHNAWW